MFVTFSASMHLFIFCSLYWRVRLYCSRDKRVRKGEHRRMKSCWGSSGPHASDSEAFWNSKLVANEIQISGGNLAQSKKKFTTVILMWSLGPCEICPVLEFLCVPTGRRAKIQSGDSNTFSESHLVRKLLRGHLWKAWKTTEFYNDFGYRQRVS